MSIKLNGILLIISTIIFIGCGDKKDKEQTQTQTTTPTIEIVQNPNAQEIKVDEKKVAKNQNKSFYYDYNINSEYDQNAQPANKDAAVRMKPRTVLDANMNIRSPYERVQISLIVKQLSSEFKVKCSACHDDYANGVVGPSLLGKDANFIYNAISDFKSGKKSNPLMADLIHMMSDKEIRKMAQDIYKFNKEIKKLGARQ